MAVEWQGHLSNGAAPQRSEDTRRKPAEPDLERVLEQHNWSAPGRAPVRRRVTCDGRQWAWLVCRCMVVALVESYGDLLAVLTVDRRAHSQFLRALNLG